MHGQLPPKATSCNYGNPYFCIPDLIAANHNKLKNTLFPVFLALFALSSCSYRSQEILFKPAEKPDTKGKAVVVYNALPDAYLSATPVTKVDDVLEVRFVNNYDLNSGVLSTDPTNREANVAYRIGADSCITLPLLGKVKAVGYTEDALASKLEKLLSEQVVEPIVDVEIVSHTVTVLGEVNRPGTYELVRERTHLVDVLANAGHLTGYAKRQKVQIIRGDLSNPEIVFVDLTMIEALENDKLFITDRDIVYIPPVRGKLFSERVRPYVFLTSILSSAVTIYVVTTRNR